MINFVFLQLGIPALVGAGIGWLLLGKSMNEKQTFFGSDPLDDYAAAILGAVVVGAAFWFVLGALLPG